MRLAVILLCTLLAGSAAHVEARRRPGLDATASRRDLGAYSSPTALQSVPLAAGRPAWTHEGEGQYRLRVPIWNVGDRPVTTVHLSMPGLVSRVLVVNWFTLPSPLPAGATTWLDAPVAPGADPLVLGSPTLRVKGFADTRATRASAARCGRRHWPAATAPWPAECDLRPIAWPAPTTEAVLAL